MNIDVREFSPQKIEFILEETTPAKANSLRRALISEVPTLAAEDIKIYENSSVMTDEMLALRIGLTPLKTKIDEFVLPEECECGGEGCSACRTKLILGGEGPTTLYSGDLKTEDGVEIPDKEIPLVKLYENQEVILEAEAIMGKGEKHTKWQPTVGCGYKGYPIQEITDECDNCGDCVEICPRNVYTLEDNEIKITNPEACSLCSLCVEECHADAITVEDDTNRFIFNFETDGSLTPQEITTTASKTIARKLEEFKETLNQ
ncbi:DNA-directed RNA polymerase subunit D [Methanonatronarchaeum sp. AMET6-2]|uniref:DNA-directed RNA polymerase subunit D n=1 Tax=Methanonatronarchaeum sp. AMET6-2 TaxID=2933293 RepID=UPI00120D049D|nr:DNA-directed RNA polymerase subunit D [Methanonatronarchaeum sp. AMET6-2]RZN62971.1 MAG: DNA-directed RNA polymerase subunit D [Methanonatronarchaeia archaeon]UOY10730.1 DNA-directed RNA polymerase subunit D [Methanonatronarchaeum sp. AMET6-2]